MSRWQFRSLVVVLFFFAAAYYMGGRTAPPSVARAVTDGAEILSKEALRTTEALTKPAGDKLPVRPDWREMTLGNREELRSDAELTEKKFPAVLDEALPWGGGKPPDPQGVRKALPDASASGHSGTSAPQPAAPKPTYEEAEKVLEEIWKTDDWNTKKYLVSYEGPKPWNFRLHWVTDGRVEERYVELRRLEFWSCTGSARPEMTPATARKLEAIAEHFPRRFLQRGEEPSPAQFSRRERACPDVNEWDGVLKSKGF